MMAGQLVPVPLGPYDSDLWCSLSQTAACVDFSVCDGDLGHKFSLSSSHLHAYIRHGFG